MAWRAARLKSLLQRCTEAIPSSSQPARACLAEGACDGLLHSGRIGQSSSACEASTSFVPAMAMTALRSRLPMHRHYSTSESTSPDASSIGNEKVQKLAAEILNLSVLESSHLTEILRKKLNLQKPAYGAMPAFAGAPAAAAAPAAPAAAAPKEEKPAEKTDFEVKLESFSADGKIKVIKEIRAITSLGLKEAKELVEKAPVVIKAAVPKADAENMKKQIEAAGGKVSLA